jgi:hypothetical protein
LRSSDFPLPPSIADGAVRKSLSDVMAALLETGEQKESGRQVEHCWGRACQVCRSCAHSRHAHAGQCTLQNKADFVFSQYFRVLVVVAFERRGATQCSECGEGASQQKVQRQPLRSLCSCLCIRGEGWTCANPSIGSMRRSAEASRVLRRDGIRRMMARRSKSHVGRGMTRRKQHSSPGGCSSAGRVMESRCFGVLTNGG